MALSPVGSSSHPASSLTLIRIAYWFFPVIVWAWVWAGPLWGMGSLVGACLLFGIVALACRESHLFWISIELAFLGFVLHAWRVRWQGALTGASLLEERCEEEINTLEGDLKVLKENQVGFQSRLERYQQLRQIANAFNASLPLEELLQRIVLATGEVIESGDRVLLYLVSPKELTLELKSVWRRREAVTIKAKTGDPFDFWVMRQAQPLLVQEPEHDFRFPEVASKELGRPLGSLLAIPLLSEHRVLGVLRVESIQPHGLGPEELRLSRIVGDLASLGIENSRLYNRMAELAITDDLTGLAVRRYFEKRLSEELARSKGLQMPVAVLLIDIDRFKDYNDTFGHSAGDKLLKHLAFLLIQTRRMGEVAARFGGEEFVCLLPGVDPEGAARWAEAIRLKMEQSQIELRRSLMRTTVSIGVATFPQDGATAESLLRVADERLYRAKSLGRNQVCKI